MAQAALRVRPQLRRLQREAALAALVEGAVAMTPEQARLDQQRINAEFVEKRRQEYRGSAAERRDDERLRKAQDRLDQRRKARPTAGQPAAEQITLPEMLGRFVQVTKGPMVIDRGPSRNVWRPHEFAALYAHCTAGKKPITTEWFTHPDRIVVDDVTFDPAEGEYPVLQAVRYFNLWREPQHDLALAVPGGADPFVDHIEYLIPDANEARDFIDYLAHCVQFPGVRPHFHFLLMTAQTGTGRGWVGALLRKLLGRKYAVETDLHRLIADSFNDILSGAITVVCNEVKAPANERFSQKDRLKSLLTDEVIEINPKYQPRRIEKLCARFLMLSNREDALPLDESDRRVYAVGCADQPRSPAYYAELYGRLTDPAFIASVWLYLKARDLSGFNPGMRAPLNAMKAQLIESGRTDEQQDAVEFVRACPWEVIYSSDLYRAILGADDGDPERRHKVQSVAAVLREIGVQSFPRKVKTDDGTTQRAMILREQSQWRIATPAMVRKVATDCRGDLKVDFFSRTDLIERWTN